MVEFSDLFDNEDDVFQKKAKVCHQLFSLPTHPYSTIRPCPYPTRLPHGMTRLLSVSAKIIDNLCQRLNLGTAIAIEMASMIVVGVYTLQGKAIFSRALGSFIS